MYVLWCQLEESPAFRRMAVVTALLLVLVPCAFIEGHDCYYCLQPDSQQTVCSHQLESCARQAVGRSAQQQCQRCSTTHTSSVAVLHLS